MVKAKQMESEEKTICIQLKRGSSKYTLSIPACSDVSELMRRCEELTKVPITGQKLIISGKSLTFSDAGKLLTECHIKEGSRVMVLGKPYDLASDHLYNQVVAIEQKVEKYFQKLKELESEVQSIENGHLPKEYEAQALKDLLKRCKKCSEDLMKNLEALDALHFEEHQVTAKNKRKSIATLTNEHLDMADVVARRIDHLTVN